MSSPPSCEGGYVSVAEAATIPEGRVLLGNTTLPPRPRSDRGPAFRLQLHSAERAEHGDSLPSRLAAKFSSFGFIHTRFEKPGDKEPMSPWCLDRSRIVLFTGGEDSILLEPVMGIRSTAFMQIGFHAIGVLSVDESSLRRVGFRYLGLGGREYSLRRCNGALHAPRSRLRTRFPASEGNGYRVSRIYTDAAAQF